MPKDLKGTMVKGTLNPIAGTKKTYPTKQFEESDARVTCRNKTFSY